MKRSLCGLFAFAGTSLVCLADPYVGYIYPSSIQAGTTNRLIIGGQALNGAQKYHFTKCFIGTDGVDETCGLTTADIEESMVKTEAIARSGMTYILADSTKFGLVASITFAPLEAGVIITDRVPYERYREKANYLELHQ